VQEEMLERRHPDGNERRFGAKINVVFGIVRK
jgi:hypothetical protein